MNRHTAPTTRAALPLALLLAAMAAFASLPAHAATAPMPAMEGMDDMPGMDMSGNMDMPAHPTPPPAGHTTPHSLQSGAAHHAPTPAHAAPQPTTLPQRTLPSTGRLGNIPPHTPNTPRVNLPALAPSSQWPATPPSTPVVHYVHNMPPVMDHNTYFHVLMEQFEGRYTAGDSLLRYSGQSWFGTDHDKLWIKSEGTVDGHRHMSDGDHEFLYDHAISTYFDLQAGVRLDLDSGPTRAWGAVGVQGLALYFFDVSATAYFNAQGVAGKLEGSYDLLITNRLILQPQAEFNFYSHTDAQRDVSQGFSDIDAGLRLRYEFKRKIAPYIAVTYAGHYGNTANHTANWRGTADNGPEDIRFTFGVRTWF